MRRLPFFLILAAPTVALVVACSGADSPVVGGGADDDDDSTRDASSDRTLPDDDGSTTTGDGGTITGDGSTTGDSGGPNKVVDETGACDDALDVYGSANSFAKAIGICSVAARDGHGLVSARFTRAYTDGDGGVGSGDATPYLFADGGTAQVAVLGRFGDVLRPREGKRLGVLSSGIAGQFDQVDDGGAHDGGTSFVSSTLIGTTGLVPPGFPEQTKGCEAPGSIHDMVDVEVVLKAPADAHGFRFDYSFLGSDWPTYVCSQFNDQVVAYVRSSTLPGRSITSDSKHGPINVNTTFFDRCTPDASVGCGSSANLADAGVSWACGAGPTELGGTGYGILGTDCANASVTEGGGTGWLTATAPITPGETFTIDFMIWDAGDGALDSTALFDHFQWLAGAPAVETTRAK